MRTKSGLPGKNGAKRSGPASVLRQESNRKTGSWTGSRTWPRLTHMALLAALSFVVFADSLAGEFVWDDNIQIVRNQSIRSLGNIPQAFTSSLWSFAHANVPSNDMYYRPIQTVIFTLTYHFGGLSPFAFHLVSVTLHAAASIMVYLLFLEFGWIGSASFLAAALFAVHPVHTEAVAWIAGAGEVACGMFYFAALWTFLRYLNTRSGRWLCLSAMLFLLALLAKEMAVTFPIAAVLMVFMKRSPLKLSFKQAVLAIAPHIVVMAAYGMLRFSSVGLSLPSTFQDQASVFDWMTFAVWMFGGYLRYAFLPYPLAAFHITPLFLSDRILPTALYALMIGAFILLLVYQRKTTPNGLMWLGMFAAMIAPVFYFKGISGGSIFAERYLYIPTLPAVALLTLFWTRLARRTAVVAAVCAIGVFSVETVARNLDWRNDESLYMRSLDVYPENEYACLNLAVVELDAGKLPRAEQCLNVAESHIDDSGYMHPRGEKYRLEIDLGTLAAHRGQSADAKVHLNRAIEIEPSAAGAYSILAGVVMNLDRDFAGAIPMLDKAIELSPVDDQARDSMGVALYNLKRYDEATRYFREALRINPRSASAQQHLDTVLKQMGTR